MKYECDLIEDLLPLYIDSACGKTSKQIVEEHLAECEKCSEMLKSYKDTEIDEAIVKEKQEIIDSRRDFCHTDPDLFDRQSCHGTGTELVLYCVVGNADPGLPHCSSFNGTEK